MPVTWSDEKLILLYCPGRGSNSRPSARRRVNMIKVSYALTTRPRRLGHRTLGTNDYSRIRKLPVNFVADEIKPFKGLDFVTQSLKVPNVDLASHGLLQLHSI